MNLCQIDDAVASGLGEKSSNEHLQSYGDVRSLVFETVSRNLHCEEELLRILSWMHIDDIWQLLPC